MPNFDFITLKPFREALDADYAEMRRSAEAGNWKAAHVLAGSIVECLLIDYLATTSSSGRGSTDALKLDLSDAINCCKSEKVITARTAGSVPIYVQILIALG